MAVGRRPGWPQGRVTAEVTEPVQRGEQGWPIISGSLGSHEPESSQS